MRLTATEVGFFEDYEDDEILAVGLAGVDEAGIWRSFSIQRSTYEPDEQDVRLGMDSYNISTERGITVYGGLQRVQLTDSVLSLVFTSEDAEILEISSRVDVDLNAPVVELPVLAGKLREILDWGVPEKRPELALGNT
jgi:hypothetical protein